MSDGDNSGDDEDSGDSGDEDEEDARRQDAEQPEPNTDRDRQPSRQAARSQTEDDEYRPEDWYHEANPDEPDEMDDIVEAEAEPLGAPPPDAPDADVDMADMGSHREHGDGSRSSPSPSPSPSPCPSLPPEDKVPEGLHYGEGEVDDEELARLVERVGKELVEQLDAEATAAVHDARECLSMQSTNAH